MKKIVALFTLGTLFSTSAITLHGIAINRETKKEQDVFTQHRTHQYDDRKARHTSGAVGPLYGFYRCTPGVTECPLFAAPSTAETYAPGSLMLFNKMLKKEIEKLQGKVEDLEEKIEEQEEKIEEREG